MNILFLLRTEIIFVSIRIFSSFPLQNIPYQFAKRYFKKNGEITLRGAKFYSNSWRAFMLDNNLKVGDMCL